MNLQWLQVCDLNKHYNGIIALEDFSFQLKRSEIVGLIGPNGAGKTTLFNVLNGFVPADSGQIFFNNIELHKKSAYKIANLGVARTFQDLRLIYQISVLENILLSFRNQPGENLVNTFFRSGLCKKAEAKNRDFACVTLKKVNLIDKANHLTSDLSYGQQKLLSLICCLVSGAELLLLDEPVAGIAPEMTEKILSIIKELPKQNKSVIIIEHNMDVITQVCHRVIFMESGKKICEGTPQQVHSNPEVIESYIN